MIVEEMFYRSGLVPINPILSDELMLHTGAITSTQMERKSGKAAEVLGKASLQRATRSSSLPTQASTPCRLKLRCTQSKRG